MVSNSRFMRGLSTKQPKANSDLAQRRKDAKKRAKNIKSFLFKKLFFAAFALLRLCALLLMFTRPAF